ncbi:MAG TPA: POTRA domain-containing protein [Kofleriaceae bacterium]|nr:POTRA domain-containing protein [Kofleriaceae bacterium]
MHARWFPMLLVACHGAPVEHPPITAGCTLARVGRVVIQGADPADVAPLAVLEGTLDDPARTDRITAVATAMLRSRGYARATIQVTRAQGCGVELHVAVDRGPHFRIAGIDFTGDELPRDEQLAAIEDALGTVNTIGGAYVPDRMQRALDALVKRYHDAGWIEAEIAPPRAIYDDLAGLVHITIPVTAGPRYRIGNVVARGGGPTSRAAVIEALGLHGGQWYDGAAVRTGIARARRSLSRRIEMRIEVSSDEPAIDVEAIVEPTP